MIIQVVDIFYSNVFKRYSTKYNIYRDLYEKDLLGLEIRNINFKFANRIKKIILSNKEICYITSKKENDSVDLLALGSFGVFKELSKEIIAIGNEDIGFKINKTLKNVSDYDLLKLTVGNKTFQFDSALLIGIVNVTPDSFSDGGKFFSTESAIEHGLQLIKEGADILDIGGESSRPGSEPVKDDEELNRVIPVIEGIIKKVPDAIISIDTQKSIVASEALKRGAKIVNDISAGSFDSNMFEVVKSFNAAFILMHMKGTPKTMQQSPYYDDVVSEVYDYLLNKVDNARKHDIKNIIIDPGIGFGKRVADNYELLKRLNEFKGIGCPIMVGLSRKSFLGKALNIEIDKREEATLIAETLAIKNGAKLIRTHNINKAAYAVKLNQFVENPELLANV
ncbi:MAG: dihydropteroate synthase [Melioribacter sp.]|nr:dihydropteroate synthase [Melioribacter sp.]